MRVSSSHLVLPGLYEGLPSFSGIYQIIPGLYEDLLSITSFYLVIPGLCQGLPSLPGCSRIPYLVLLGFYKGILVFLAFTWLTDFYF